MRKFIPFIAICLFCLNINAQITEAYPTSQRYLFNPYNRDSVYIDSARFCDVNFLYGYNHAWFDGVFYPCNEYQCILCPMIPLFKYTVLLYPFILIYQCIREARIMKIIGGRTILVLMTIQLGTYTGKRLLILCTCFGLHFWRLYRPQVEGEYMRDTFILSRRPMTLCIL